MRRLAVITAAIAISFCLPLVAIAGTDLVFSDTQGHWAQAAIARAAEQDLMHGIGENEQGELLFTPEGAVTRSQAAAILTRAFGLDYGDKEFEKEPLPANYYQDVNHDAWYAESVLLCAINNVFSFEGERFYPDRQVTRMEMALAIQNSFMAKNINVPMILMMPHFNDTQDLSNAEMNAVVFVHNTGIMKGNEGYFHPYDNLTRAEMARIIIACKDLIDLNTSADQIGSSVSIDKKAVQEQIPHMEIDLELPVVTGMGDQSLQEKINSRWGNEAESFKQEVASTLDEYVKNAEISGYPVHTYQAFSRVQKGYSNGQFLSLYVDYYSYTGGAHGFTDRRAYNIDLNNGQDLALSDLFTTNYDYTSVINEFIAEQIKTNPGNFFEGDMGFTGIDEQQSYYIKDGNLVIYFGLYEIAPYAAGIQEFKIPLKSFAGNLRIPE